MKRFLLPMGLSVFCFLVRAQDPSSVKTSSSARASSPAAKASYTEPFRPQVHFSPRSGWMNDPNGMLYYKGVYHLFYQYYPDALVWGPMHWGHATSKDMLHWHHEPIALYPDSLGYIFSGSAVVDKDNTSGFGKIGVPPLVAIYTAHDPAGEKAKRNDFQNQCIAYSLDQGRTWTKYAHNPVLHNPGITDFRDPKVMWYAPRKRWIMTLAVNDRVSFYSSPDLKNWQLESQFGEDKGAHGGVWECPDLFELNAGGLHSWVLIVNINPGGPNAGSATQYFLGNFDGKSFVPSTAGTRWLDYGPDEYAGVTWSNTGGRRLFLGWMSNWLYGQAVPTTPWRSAFTLPRELGLQRVKDSLYITSLPVHELGSLVAGKQRNQSPADGLAFPRSLPSAYEVVVRTVDTSSFELAFSNDRGEKTLVGYDSATRQFYIDRRESGILDFSPAFAGRFTAPRIAFSSTIPLRIYADASSFEVFADDGLTTMTLLAFPHTPYRQLRLVSGKLRYLQVMPLASVW